MSPSLFKPPTPVLLTLTYVTEYFVAGWQWRAATGHLCLTQCASCHPPSWAGWSLGGKACSQHTAQRNGQAAICEERTRAPASRAMNRQDLVFISTETQKRRPLARLQGGRHRLGQDTSVQAGAVRLSPRDVTACSHVHRYRERASSPRLVFKALLTNFIPDAGKLGRQLFLLHEGTFILKRQNGHGESPRRTLRTRLHMLNHRVMLSKYL